MLIYFYTTPYNELIYQTVAACRFFKSVFIDDNNNNGTWYLTVTWRTLYTFNIYYRNSRTDVHIRTYNKTIKNLRFWKPNNHTTQ